MDLPYGYTYKLLETKNGFVKLPHGGGIIQDNPTTGKPYKFVARVDSPDTSHSWFVVADDLDTLYVEAHKVAYEQARQAMLDRADKDAEERRDQLDKWETDALLGSSDE